LFGRRLFYDRYSVLFGQHVEHGLVDERLLPGCFQLGFQLLDSLLRGERLRHVGLG